MRYPCLVLDHDDTVVNSTATIHYPSFLAYLAQVRPGLHYTRNEYFRKNFDPGVLPFFTGELGFTPQELEDEFAFWREYVRTRVPQAFAGIREILLRHRAAGGLIAVVSHSYAENILRDYRENSLPEPDAVFGWEYPEAQRKPNPYPLEQLMARFSLRTDELLMLDDLKPGLDMCRSCGVAFAAAGWAYDVPQIEAFMRANAGFYFKTVAELAEFLRRVNG